MTTGFYPKLAFDGIRKNKRMYLPYLCTCIGMVMMYYIIVFLANNPTLIHMTGGETVTSMLDLGGWVIAFFAAIFLFYTNSFLMRRRKREFGLYNVLGMGKWNIAKILFWEALLLYGASLGVGVGLGASLSKAAELGLIRLVGGEVNYTLSVSVSGILMSLKVFGAIFGLLFLNSLRQLKAASAVALLRSEAAGEKPPRANWFFGLAGILVLGAAYYIAVRIRDPITALALFFVAVLLVILGTYLLMIAGSVMFCRILQKHRGYYYKPNHFVSVSSMVYRMKRNGAGLASICVLATMVLVMISSTASLYIGAEDALHSRYPREIVVSANFTFGEDPAEAARAAVEKVQAQHGIAPAHLVDYHGAAVTGLLEDGEVETDVTEVEGMSLSLYDSVCQFLFVPLEEYNAMTGANETLGPGEALLYAYRRSYDLDSIAFHNGPTFTVKRQLEEAFISGDMMVTTFPALVLVVPDLEESLGGLNRLADYYGNPMVSRFWEYAFDTGLSDGEQIALGEEIAQALEEQYLTIESRAAERSDFFAAYGGLFYLGILLSIVFIIAAVLIIYYKQISEGYEDQARFEIMQKVGMTRREIRRSINSQLLTVFFLPLGLSACHLAFAFPVLRKLLLLFGLDNLGLFAVTTGVSLLVFALLYTLVYKITSNSYYTIVSGGQEQ